MTNLRFILAEIIMYNTLQPCTLFLLLLCFKTCFCCFVYTVHLNWTAAVEYQGPLLADVHEISQIRPDSYAMQVCTYTIQAKQEARQKNFYQLHSVHSWTNQSKLKTTEPLDCCWLDEYRSLPSTKEMSPRRADRCTYILTKSWFSIEWAKKSRKFMEFNYKSLVTEQILNFQLTTENQNCFWNMPIGRCSS